MGDKGRSQQQAAAGRPIAALRRPAADYRLPPLYRTGPPFAWSRGPIRTGVLAAPRGCARGAARYLTTSGKKTRPARLTGPRLRVTVAMLESRPPSLTLKV